MSESLRDQLLKSGLAKTLKPERPQSRPQQPISPQRPLANTQREAQRRSNSSPRSATPAPRQRDQPGRGSDIDLAKAYALRDRNEREQREREQKAAEQRAREKKERRQKVAGLLAGVALNESAAEIPRHFPHANKIRRIYVTETQLPQLNNGELAVVQLAGRYLLVARDKAIAVQAVDADALVLLCDPQQAAEDDVPADIVW